MDDGALVLRDKGEIVMASQTSSEGANDKPLRLLCVCIVHSLVGAVLLSQYLQILAYKPLGIEEENIATTSYYACGTALVVLCSWLAWYGVRSVRMVVIVGLVLGTVQWGAGIWGPMGGLFQRIVDDPTSLYGPFMILVVLSVPALVAWCVWVLVCLYGKRSSKFFSVDRIDIRAKDQ
jgi:hypothetical protein